VLRHVVYVGLVPTREAVWQYFVSKCSNNLHVVMAMTPVGDRLRSVLLVVVVIVFVVVVLVVVDGKW